MKVKSGRPPKTKLEVERRAREALAERGFVRRAELLEGLAQSSVDAVLKRLVASGALVQRELDGVPVPGLYIVGPNPI